ncbi:MAG: NUDIX domain-containing protein [bacterium]
MVKVSHPIQLGIIKKLMFLSVARFSDLNDTDLTNDHFTFHIKKLISDKVIEKLDLGYRLTPAGLLYSSNLDMESLEVPHIKVGVKLYITRKQKGKTQVLLGERLREPFKGSVGFHTTKVRPNESVFDTAKRCLLFETGLRGDFEYVGMEYVIERNPNALNSSRMMNYIRVVNLKNKMVKLTEESNNMWVNLDDVSKTKNTYKGIEDDLKLFQRKKIFFCEKLVVE